MQMKQATYLAKLLIFNKKCYIAELILYKNHVLTHAVIKFTIFIPMLLKIPPILLPAGMKIPGGQLTVKSGSHAHLWIC